MRAVPVTKLLVFRMKLMTSASQPVVVEEFRLRVQFFLQDVHALVLDDVADLALRVEEVAELASAHRANLHALRIQAFAHPLDAEPVSYTHLTLPTNREV